MPRGMRKGRVGGHRNPSSIYILHPLAFAFLTGHISKAEAEPWHTAYVCAILRSSCTTGILACRHRGRPAHGLPVPPPVGRSRHQYGFVYQRRQRSSSEGKANVHVAAALFPSVGGVE